MVWTQTRFISVQALFFVDSVPFLQASAQAFCSFGMVCFAQDLRIPMDLQFSDASDTWYIHLTISSRNQMDQGFSLQGYGCYGPRCYQWLFVRWETAVTTTPTWISWDVCVHSHLSDPIGTASTVLEFQSANRQCGDLYPLPKGCHVM